MTVTCPGVHAQAAGLEVQAASIRIRGAFVHQRFGSDGLHRFREAASPALRQALDGRCSGGGWVPFALQIEGTLLIDQLFGAGDLALAEEIGAFAATQDAGVWKTLFMRTVPPALMARVLPSLWSHYYRNGGALRMTITGPTAMLITIDGFPAPHPAHCRAMAGWARATLEHGPRVDIRATEVKCRTRGEDSCLMNVTWR